MKKTFWNKLTARGTRGKTRCAAAVLALAMTFSMGAPLALAAQPEESTAAVTETVSAQHRWILPDNSCTPLLRSIRSCHERYFS